MTTNSLLYVVAPTNIQVLFAVRQEIHASLEHLGGERLRRNWLHSKQARQLWPKPFNVRCEYGVHWLCGPTFELSEGLGVATLARALPWRKVPPRGDNERREHCVRQREDPERSLVEDEAL